MIKAVFFDVDETLVDASTYHGQSTWEAFECLGFDSKAIEKKIEGQNFFGRRVSEILKIIRDASEISETQLPLQQLITKREEIFLKLVKEHVELLPGAKKAVEYAAKYTSAVGIVSSGTRRYLRLLLDKFNLGRYISIIVSGEDVDHGKPNPECYEKAFALLPKDMYIRKSECLVFEDSPIGIEAAKKAGMQVTYIPFPGNSEIVDEKLIDRKLSSLIDVNKELFKL